MSDFVVRETAGRRALAAVAAGAVVIVGAPVLGMSIAAGFVSLGGAGLGSVVVRETRGTIVPGASTTTASVTPEPASLIRQGTVWDRVLPGDALVPTPGAAALAGLGLLVAVIRRRA